MSQVPDYLLRNNSNTGTNTSSFVAEDIIKKIENMDLAKSYTPPAGTNSVLYPAASSYSGPTPSVETDTPFYGKIGSLDSNGNYTGGEGLAGFLGNAKLMSTLTGLGSLGLGVANYFQNRGLLDKQKEGLAQNIAFAKEDQDRQRTNRQSAANYEYRDRTGVA